MELPRDKTIYADMATGRTRTPCGSRPSIRVKPKNFLIAACAGTTCATPGPCHPPPSTFWLCRIEVCDLYERYDCRQHQRGPNSTRRRFAIWPPMRFPAPPPDPYRLWRRGPSPSAFGKSRRRGHPRTPACDPTRAKNSNDPCIRMARARTASIPYGARSGLAFRDDRTR